MINVYMAQLQRCCHQTAIENSCDSDYRKRSTIFISDSFENPRNLRTASL
jgi:hypothetical protein